MPAKKGKMSSKARKARAAKAAVTRCQNKCVATGGKRSKRKLKSPSAARKRADQAFGPWRAHLAAFRAQYGPLGNNKFGGDNAALMSAASASYQRKKAAGQL